MSFFSFELKLNPLWTKCMDHPASRNRSGVRVARTDQELTALADAFFQALKVPEWWKFKGNDIARNSYPIDVGGWTTNVLSIGKVFINTKSSGIALTFYKVGFLTFSERGFIVEKSFADFGKFKYHTVLSNKTIDQINDYIKTTYGE